MISISLIISALVFNKDVTIGWPVLLTDIIIIWVVMAGLNGGNC